MAMENPFSIAMLVYRSVLLKTQHTAVFSPRFQRQKIPLGCEPMLELRRSCLNSIESV